MSAFPHILGVDVGSVAVAVVALNSKYEIVRYAYEFHHGHTAQALKDILNRFDLKAVGGVAATTGTPPILHTTRHYDNRVAIIKAAHFEHDRIGSILVVGGEKFGLIRFDERGNYLGFKSNTGCAAGTGSFLDQQARRLNLEDSAELSRIAISNKAPIPKIASRCAVFAKTDLVHAQQEGCSLAQICDGLCLGLARNIFDTLFTASQFLGPIVFTGGVSRNQAVVKHLQSLIGHEIITEGTLLHGAFGAALSLAEACPTPGRLGLESADDLLIVPKAGRSYYYDPLELTLSDFPDFGGLDSYNYRAGDGQPAIDVEVDIYQDLKHCRRLAAYLGIDVGSTSSKAVLIDHSDVVVAGFYTRTAGKPVAAVQGLLAAIDDMMLKQGVGLKISAAGTTGAGRKFVGKIIGADMAIDEITAHARAAVEIDPRVDTIIEIGGQDAKFTTLKNGRVTFSVMNNVCAAGTGSFIEEQAQKLNCPLSQYSNRAAHRKSPLASDRCTVFMERDLNHFLTAGYPVDDLLAAVLHSVRENYLTKVADEKNIGEVIFFQGATAKNKALVAAFENRLGKPIRVSRYCHLTGALGAALMLSDRAVAATDFRGLNLYKKNIPLHNETCELCTNHCKLTVAEIDGTREAYGFLCGRDYDTKHFVNNNRSGFDLLRERARVFAVKKPSAYREKFTIGIPAALYLLEDLPFWQSFFNDLGIKTVTGKSLVDSLKVGKRLAGAEFCAPMIALYAHVNDLVDRSDYVFLPYYLDKKGRSKGPRRQFCYYSQFVPGLAAPAVGGPNREKFLMPVVHYLYNTFHTKAQLYRMLRDICRRHISYFDVSSAYDRAAEFMKTGRDRWRAVYQTHSRSSNDPHVVLLGRPYNVLSAAMHKGIPNILAALGIKAFFRICCPIPGRM